METIIRRVAEEELMEHTSCYIVELQDGTMAHLMDTPGLPLGKIEPIEVAAALLNRLSQA